ncbi:MAG: SPOR domain-containing protein [Candidatus Latescibacteria bacterium]|nr:SPOR domain-containing protein [Candidatus Latescibacterota bacterium]
MAHSGRVCAFPVAAWFLCVVLACGPAPSVKPSRETQNRSLTEAAPEHEDPVLAVSELKGLVRDRAAADSVSRPLPPAAPPPALSFRLVQGYRVQLFSVRDQTAALAMKRETQQRLADLNGVSVYIDGDPPYYRVRVGDCLTRSDAEKLATLLRSKKGYTDTWVVETLVHPPSPDPLPKQ